MAITIEIPTAFRRFTEGLPKVDSGATTVAEALNDLTVKFPALSRHVRDEQGQSASSSTSISTKKTSASSTANLPR